MSHHPRKLTLNIKAEQKGTFGIRKCIGFKREPEDEESSDDDDASAARGGRTKMDRLGGQRVLNSEKLTSFIVS